PSDHYTLSLHDALPICEMGGKTHRGFCPECGSPIQVKPDAVPQFVAIRTASLDDPSSFNPQVDVWTSDAQPWDRMNPALPKFERSEEHTSELQSRFDLV